MGVSLGGSSRAELWEEMMSILTYSLSTYCVCPGLRLQWGPGVTDNISTNK